MITLTLTDEQLQKAFQTSLNALLTPGNYDNPIKRTLDNLLGYSSKSEIKFQLEHLIEQYVKEAMLKPEFSTAIGQAMAVEIAKKQVEKMR